MTSPGDASSAPTARTPELLLDARAALGLLALYLGTQLVAGFVFGSLYGALRYLEGGVTDPESLERAIVSVQAPLGLLAALFAGAAVLTAVLRRARASQGAAIRGQVGLALGSRPALALGLVAGALLALVYFPLVAGLLFPPAPDHAPGPITRMALSPGWQRWMWSGAALLAAPPVEELVFRGALQAGFARSWGWGPAAAVTTALFVSLHYSEFAGYLPAAGALVLLSALALGLRWRSGALGPAIAAHAGYNLAIFLFVSLGPLLGSRA